MRKLSTLVIALLVISTGFSQIVPVTYRGAFAPAPTPMWTDGWVQWDPNAVNYGAPTVSVSGAISSNTTWTANNVYELSGVVTIDSLITLTIEPGTVIRGKSAVPNSCLIVRRGAKLYAIGTAAKPIVFTSDKAAGNRNPGDWGGVILLGKGVTNATGGFAFIEGLNNIPESQYGGGLTPDANDNSGQLSYVRIEFGGYVFQPNVEINGLTFGAVGAGTQIDHIQCSFINDDSYEWFGGSVNCSYLVAYRGVDDNFDTDNGFSGKVQFCLGVRDPNLWDPTFANASGASTSEGFESDNDAGGSNNNPRTSAVFSNVTDIGPFRGTSNPSSDLQGFRRAARIRRNSQLNIFNSIFMDWRTGLFIDGSASENNALSGVLNFRNNIIAGAATNRNILRTTAAAIGTYAGLSAIDSVATTTNLLINPYQYLTPDYRPTSTSLALSNFDFSSPVLPVTLTRFDGETIKNVNYLTWETSTEISNRGFHVERSADGRSFSSIAFVPTRAINGNSNGKIIYNLADNKPLAGLSYYRLKQEDINGRSTYSRVVMLQTLVGNDLQFSMVYPNPVKSQLNLVVMAPAANRINMQIIDAVGRIIATQSFKVERGSNQLTWNIGSLSTGRYTIKSTDADNKSTNIQALIKQ